MGRPRMERPLGRRRTRPQDTEVFAAIGWLAREGKVDIQTNPDDEKDLLFTLVQGC